MRKILLLVCMMTVIFGCSDDEEKAWTEIEIPTPAMSRMLLTEFCKSDGIGVSDVTKREEFSYQENWLTDYIYSQEVSIADLTETITNPIAVRYENNRGSVTLTDETGIQRKYTLNEQGYATQCEYTSFGQKREYTFSYTDGYLTLVKETSHYTNPFTEIRARRPGLCNLSFADQRIIHRVRRAANPL